MPHQLLNQFNICIWRLFFANIVRRINFYVCFIMAVFTIMVCLFWPTTAYEVIFGKTHVTEPTKSLVQFGKSLTFSRVIIGPFSNANSDETNKLIRSIKNAISLTTLCQSEYNCEMKMKTIMYPNNDNYIYKRDADNNVMMILCSVNNDGTPSVLLKVPYLNIHHMKIIESDLLPLRSLLDTKIYEFIKNRNKVTGLLQFGYKLGKDKLVDTVEVKELQPLVQFSAGIMAAHQYLGLVFMVLHMTSAFVHDKETGLRALLSIMGMHRFPYVCAYIFIYCIISIILCFYGALLIMITPKLIKETNRTYYTYFMVLINYIAMGTYIICQSFLLAALVRSVRIITFIVLCAHCLQVIVAMTILKFQLDLTDELTSETHTYSWMDYLFPVIGFLNAHIELFSGMSANGQKESPSMKVVQIFMVSIMYFILGLYFDMVIDTGTGHTYPWYYFLVNIRRYFTKEKTKKPELYGVESKDSAFSFTEEINPNLVRVKLVDVDKVFTWKKCFHTNVVTAVKSVNLRIQEGKITALLGHNGAGKSTIFNMLVGLLKPTSGHIQIYNLNPDDPWEKVTLNQMTSICMQSDVLFSNLTCIEHMKLFGVMKSLSKTSIMSEINMLFNQLDLMRDKNKYTSILSGGERRKLCVAMALMGNPKVVLLDEPTSGVDPISRRCIWNALKEHKKDRIMIISTHYMDEADILADWKAIIVKGSVACYGTSMFLKKKFGLGYMFTCTLSSNKESTEELIKFIHGIIAKAEFKKRYGMEVTFRINDNDIISLCNAISVPETAAQMLELGIIDFGISLTKLEEIFLKLDDVEKESESVNVIEKLIETNSKEELDQVKTETVVPQEQLTVNDTCIKLLENKHSNFIIGLFQFWTFIRLNIMLSLRTPMFAVLRTIGPFLAVMVSMFLYKFEISRAKKFEMTNTNISFINRDQWPRLLFYSFVENADQQKSEKEFIADLKCVHMMYETTSLYTRQTHEFKAVGYATYMNISEWNRKNGYKVIYTYMTKISYRYIFFIQTLFQNCLFQRQGLQTINKVQFISVVYTGNILWGEIYHPSFMTTSAFVYFMALSTAFSLMNPVIAGDVVRDRMTQNLSQMTMYGLKYLSYWGAHFLLHQLHFVLIMCIVIIFMNFVDNYLFSQPAYTAIFAILFNLASVDTILVIYCISFAFNDIMSAEIFLSFSILVPMFMMSIVIFCPLHLISLLHFLFLSIFPFLNPWITLMMIDFKTRRINQYLNDTFNPEHIMSFSDLVQFQPVFHSIIIHGIHIIVLSGWFIGYTTYIFVIRRTLEKRALIHMLRNPDVKSGSLSTTVEDLVKRANFDLKENKNFVEELMASPERDKVTAAVSNLTKVYQTYKRFWSRKTQTTVAMSDLNLVIYTGEIFGLLGPSGAGKSTVVNCMANIVPSTSGHVIVYDKEKNRILSNIDAVKMNKIGVCPQTNPIWPNLTVREHLLVYASLRGIPRACRKIHAEEIIRLVHLRSYTNTMSEALSGGCKRRLSLAISFVGHPDLILLDEPSCGVDPKSRRNLWETISTAIHNTNKGALITTQFMEECEALCNRLGIIVNGRITCLGSPQELKSKFGRGIFVEIKIYAGISEEENINIKSKLTQFMLDIYPNVLLVEQFGERISYRIPKDPSITFGQVFESVHRAQSIFKVEDYAVSQPTLEQIYFDFAKYQKTNDLKFDFQVQWK